VLLEKLQKVVYCLNPELKAIEYSVETIQNVFAKQIEPILLSLEYFLKDNNEGLKKYFEMFEQDEKDDNYDYNKGQLEQKKRLELEMKNNDKLEIEGEKPEDIYVEKYYKVKSVVNEMTESEMTNWEDLNKRGNISERIDLMKQGRFIPIKVVMRFLMNYSRTVGRRYFAQEVKALSLKDCFEYINGNITHNSLFIEN
jgi:hypothetical protein